MVVCTSPPGRIFSDCRAAPVTLAARRLDGATAFVEVSANRVSWEGRSAAQVLIRGVTEQMEILAQAGCDHAQGYYFSKPVQEAAPLDMLPRQSIH